MTAMAEDLEFCLLGPLVVRSGGLVVPMPRGHQRAVLAAMLLARNQVVTIDELAGVLWGQQPPSSAKVTVRSYVKRLRDVLGQAGRERIGTHSRGYLIHVDEGELDLARFENLLASARAAARDGSWEETADRVREALSMWRGEPLTGIRSETLTLFEVPRLAELRLQATELRIEAGIRLGGHAEAVAELARLTTAHPLREHLQALHLLALYRCGQRADALAAYQQISAMLAAELGADPGAELLKLHQQILAADPDLGAPVPTGTESHGSGPGAADGSAPGAADGSGPGAAGGSGPGAADGSAPGAADGSGPAAAQPAGPAAGGAAVPRQLPLAAPHFSGRRRELAALRQALETSTGDRGTVAISTVSGMAGVGKTSLAIHCAHQVADWFQDGQLYVNLRGFDPSSSPASPSEAIRGFLDALGVAAEQIPTSLDAQAGLYRSLLADKRMLIVLDNARDEQQVRPLLPAGPGSAVLVTSRSELPGLAAAEGARLLRLDVLSEADARQMLTARLGAQRATAEPDGVRQIVNMCARLPLALAVAATWATSRPEFSLAAVAAGLRDSRNRLDAFDAGDPAANVRAVFSWSYATLSPGAARLFRLLSLHPGPDFGGPAVASLAGTSQPEARRLLAELARAHLIAEHFPGRYAFHDLLRAYAAEQAHANDSGADRRQAIHRALDHYLHTAARAGRQMNPVKIRQPVVLDPPRPGVVLAQPADYHQALAWFEEEKRVLLALIALAAESGFFIHAWQLPWAMSNFLSIRGHHQERAAAQRTALAAARRLGDDAAQALSGCLLAGTYVHLGDLDQAFGHFARSLALYQRLGDRHGEAMVHDFLADLAGRQRRYADMLGHSEQALRTYQSIGDKTFEAVALNNVGYSHGLLGDYRQARSFSRQALTLCAELPNPLLEGCTWDSLGYAEHHLGNFTEAVACFQRALRICRENGNRSNEADALIHLGDSYQAANDLPLARDAWQQALAILDEVQHPDAAQVRAKVAGIDGRAARGSAASAPASLSAGRPEPAPARSGS
jgi:DNA-binding SARP family transcriptional activator